MSKQPQLHPAPGRVIIRMVPRFTKAGQIDLTDKYQHQPMVGELVALGDPRNENEAALCAWAKTEAEAGHSFIFSAWGAGSDIWTPEMETMKSIGYDFRWLQGYRLFDIGQLGMTVSNCGVYGELLVEKTDVN